MAEFHSSNKYKKKKSKDGKDSDSKKKKRSKPLPVALESMESEEFTKLMRTLHDQSGPYKHLVLDPLYDPEKLREVHEEVKHNMTATYKETDLFKLFQTGELGNLTPDDELGAKMPELLRLRSSIYSKEFRNFVQNITGCGELTDRVDFSGNAYTCQCHLMCHDDVISTRCVSFIIYLTDPDEPWTAADGGALELYPLEKEPEIGSRPPTPKGSNSNSNVLQRRTSLGSLSYDTFDNIKKDAVVPSAGSDNEQGIPAAIPTLNLLPKFNSMAMFVVQPGRSYHAVQEVFGDKPRLSISGWFHAAEPPVGSDMASLKQIMSKGDLDLPFVPVSPVVFKDCPPDTDEDKTVEQELEEMKISQSDMNILKQYVNAEYLRPANMLKIRNNFIEDSSIQLRDFLNEDIEKLISEASHQTDAADQLGESQIPKYTAGVTKRWACIGPPHKHRYLRYNESVDRANAGSEDVGALLSDIRQQLFRSAVFHRYLYQLTNIRVTEHRDEIRRFRPGLDYTVAHHGTLVESPRLDATLCFADTRDEDKAELWDGGDVGGFECYIAAEDDTDADATAEVYKAEKDGDDENEDGDLLSVQAGCNVLNIVMRDEGVMKFVKYVSHKAPSSRWDLAIEYNIEIDSDDEDESVSGEEFADESDEDGGDFDSTGSDDED